MLSLMYFNLFISLFISSFFFVNLSYSSFGLNPSYDKFINFNLCNIKDLSFFKNSWSFDLLIVPSISFFILSNNPLIFSEYSSSFFLIIPFSYNLYNNKIFKLCLLEKNSSLVNKFSFDINFCKNSFLIPSLSLSFFSFCPYI